MAKIVFDFKPNPNPKNDDLIVYDQRTQSFIQIPKSVFLDDTNKKIKEVKKENQELKNEIKELREKIGQLAIIIKESVIK